MGWESNYRSPIYSTTPPAGRTTEGLHDTGTHRHMQAHIQTRRHTSHKYIDTDTQTETHTYTPTHAQTTYTSTHTDTVTHIHTLTDLLIICLLLGG